MKPPDTIYLQFDPDDPHGSTWCADRIEPADVAYRRVRRASRWLPASAPPALYDGWVLVAVRPLDRRERPYVDIGTYDERGWRGKWGAIRGEVVCWRRLPAYPESEGKTE